MPLGFRSCGPVDAVAMARKIEHRLRYEGLVDLNIQLRRHDPLDEHQDVELGPAALDEAEEEDEHGTDLDRGEADDSDCEPSLGSTHAIDQEEAWRHGCDIGIDTSRVGLSTRSTIVPRTWIDA